MDKIGHVFLYMKRNIMRKVTVGFKCHPELNHRLLDKAQTAGVSLSEYVETLCENAELQIANNHEKLDPQVGSLEEELLDVKTELYYYETEMLGPLFERYQDDKLEIKLSNGDVSYLHINSPKDVLKAMLHALEIA